MNAGRATQLTQHLGRSLNALDSTRHAYYHQDDGTATMPPEFADKPPIAKAMPAVQADQLLAAVASAAAAVSSVPASQPAPELGPPPTRRRRVIMNLDRAVTWSYRYFLCQAVSPLIPVTSDHPTSHELRRRRHRQNDNWFALLSSMPTYVFSDV